MAELSRKKREELAHLSKFRDVIGLEGEINPVSDGEGPDFIVTAAASQIGIELTRLHRPAEPSRIGRRRMEGIRENVLDTAKRIWESSGLPNIEVHVSFNQHKTPSTKSDVREMAIQLTHTVQSNLPIAGESRHLRWDWRRPNVLPDGVHYLSISRLVPYRRSYWLPLDADYCAPLEESILQATISAKNSKIECYRSVSAVTWLVIILDSGRLSGWFDLRSSALRSVYESSFNRTIVFDTSAAQVIDLKTRSPLTAPARTS